MKRVILLLGLTIFAIAIIQNSQPIALVFFGFKIPWELPLSLWLFVSIMAGALTSLLLQFLNLTAIQTSARVTNTRSPEPNNSPPSRSPRKEEFTFSRKTQKQKEEFSRKKQKEHPEPFYTSDPESQQSESKVKEAIADNIPENETEWNIVEPPNEPTPVEKFDPSLDKYQSTAFEAPQEPQNVSRSGSIYSYTYKKSERTAKKVSSPQKTTQSDRSSQIPRESRDLEPDPSSQTYPEPEKYPEPQQSDRVYDARYKVIVPPYRELPYEPLEDEDDEDWIE